MELDDFLKGTRKLIKDGYLPNDYLADLLGEPYRIYRKEWNNADKSNTAIPEFPLQLDFQLNNRCNYRCIMCYWGSPEELSDWSNPAREFPFEKFCEIVSHGVRNNNLKAINFEGLNEPLLKKDLPEYIAFANKMGVLDLTLHTNGLLLDRDWSEKLIESGLTRLMVSIDAFSKETYLKIRRSNRYEQVVKNIGIFLKARTELGAILPLLRVSFIHHPFNIHEAEDFRKFWEKYADYILMQEYFDIPNLLPEREFVMKDSYSDGFCQQPFYRMSIKANGDVFPCCCSLGHVYLVGGNVFKSSVPDLWKSDEFEKIRQVHKKGKYYEIHACKICLGKVFF